MSPEDIPPGKEMGREELCGCLVRPDLLSREGMDTLVRSPPPPTSKELPPEDDCSDGLGLIQGGGPCPGRGVLLGGVTTAGPAEPEHRAPPCPSTSADASLTAPVSALPLPVFSRARTSGPS